METPEGIKVGDWFLWYEDEHNWGINQLVHYHKDGGVYETQHKGNVMDTHVIGKVTKMTDAEMIMYRMPYQEPPPEPPDHEGPLTAPDAFKGGFADNC